MNLAGILLAMALSGLLAMQAFQAKNKRWFTNRNLKLAQNLFFTNSKDSLSNRRDPDLCLQFALNPCAQNPDNDFNHPLYS